MDIRLDHPKMLSEFETGSASRLRAWVGVVMGLWLLLGAVDWAARFWVFRWQEEWRPVRIGSAVAGRGQTEAVARTIPAQTGAGLTQMVPVPRVAARYAEFHPDYLQQRDPWGYFNGPAPADGYYPVVMVGDSFMISLGTQHVAQALSSIGNISVYNHGMFAAGPFREMEKFIFSARFDPPPRVVVWNLSARELGAPLFQRQPIEAWFANIDVWARRRQTDARGQLRWGKLAPSELSRAWPNTSLAAFFSRRSWSQARLLVFGAWPSDVLGAADPQFGPMLFYGENLRLLSLYRPETDAPAVAEAVMRVVQGFRERGIALVVLLVPEKEQIHMAALPQKHRDALLPSQGLLAAIEQELEAKGVPVVNLMPVFQETTAAGQRLYWRDDTHWNDEGIRLAAEELWRVVEPLLERDQESISNIQHSISNDQVSGR